MYGILVAETVVMHFLVNWINKLEIWDEVS